MRVVKKETRKTKCLSYMSNLYPALEYVSACCDPCWGQIYELSQLKQEAAQFKNHTKDSDWEILAQRRTIVRLCALFKAYCSERAWEAIRDRLWGAYCLCGVDHFQNIRYRKQRKDIGMYSFINRTIKNWNPLPAEALGLSHVNLRFLETALGKQL